MSEHNKILILCKVVDNFGDIGVVYRLARALSDIRPSLELTLVVSNLDSFNKMASQIDPKKRIQDFHYRNSTWKILDWNLEIEDGKWKMENDIIKTEKTSPSTEFSDNQNSKFSIFNFQFSVILECFQCGRPDWLENLLFSDDFTKPVQILNIDYLTAEDYAEEPETAEEWWEDYPEQAQVPPLSSPPGLCSLPSPMPKIFSIFHG